MTEFLLILVLVALFAFGYFITVRFGFLYSAEKYGYHRKKKRHSRKKHSARRKTDTEQI